MKRHSKETTESHGKQKYRKNDKMDELEGFASGALATVIRVARFGGIAPLKFLKKGVGWRVKLSLGWTFYGYFIVTGIIIATIAALIIDLHLPTKETLRMNTSNNRMVWIFDTSCMMLIGGTCVFEAPIRMRSFITVLNKVEKINLELNQGSWPMNFERKKTFFFFFWVLFTFALTNIDHFFMMSAPQMTDGQMFVSMMYTCFYFCYSITQLWEMTFVMITLHVMYCFRVINKTLKSLLHELTVGNELPLMTQLFSCSFFDVKKRTSFKNTVNVADFRKTVSGFTKTTNHCETVRRLTVAYAKTCDMVQVLDGAHGLIALMMLGSFLLHLVVSLYYLINFIVIKDSPTSYSVEGGISIYCITIEVLWCVYHTGHLLMLIEPCHLTYSEMETTRQLVSHLMRCLDSTYDPLSVELDLFFKQLFLNQTSYSALQATKISRSLVATIIGSIMTYLVLIV